MSFVLLSLGLLLDYLLGEPKKYHPLVGFGYCATVLEKKFNTRPEQAASFFVGLVSVSLLTLPIVIFVGLSEQLLSDIHPLLSAVLASLVIYWAIGYKSLVDHAKSVFDALLGENNLDPKQQVSLMVSRDSTNMSETEITRATIESTLENGCDALFGALFWFLIGGVSMVVFYRLINTLDAMWGYRRQPYEFFGKSAAWLDDLLNYVPARLTALSYSLCGNTRAALNSWRKHAKQLASPNGGPVMSSGAGSLGISLGGPASYHGETLNKPYFGGRDTPVAADILRAIKLIRRAVLLWFSILLMLSLSYHYLAVMEVFL